MVRWLTLVAATTKSPYVRQKLLGAVAVVAGVVASVGIAGLLAPPAHTPVDEPIQPGRGAFEGKTVLVEGGRLVAVVVGNKRFPSRGGGRTARCSAKAERDTGYAMQADIVARPMGHTSSHRPA